MSPRIGCWLGAIMIVIGPAWQTSGAEAACEAQSDTVLAEQAVGPSYIEWDSECLPHADIVYVDQSSWELRVMDEHGGNTRCLTCPDDNVLGVNFPLDGDGQGPDRHWKGAPEAHPTQPVILFHAENEYSDHVRRRNAPSIGWDNDLWALNVCTKTYTRLTRLPKGDGLQHSAMSTDGAWYVYPHRYEKGRGLKDFGLVRMVFSELAVDADGALRLTERFTAEPDGEMYYEPHHIRPGPAGTYALLYTAGDGAKLDPYRYDWSCGQGGACRGTSRRLAQTPRLHEEFTMFSPTGKAIAWMRGPLRGLGYHADLYISDPDFNNPQRITWYSDCSVWPDRCSPKGAQLSRLSWHPSGLAIFYGLWEHEGLLRMGIPALHRLDLTGSCDQPTAP